MKMQPQGQEQERGDGDRQQERSLITRQLGDAEQGTSGGFEMIREVEGDLFELAPEGSVLIHATNALGAWGTGIATSFRTRFPTAYTTYHRVCTQSQPQSLVGTCLLIPPPSSSSPPSASEGKKNHWVACLFTSRAYGRGKPPPAEILGNTERAVRDLLGRWRALKEGEGGVGAPGELWACRFNSGRFGVEWRETRGVVERVLKEENDRRKGEGEMGLVVVKSAEDRGADGGGERKGRGIGRGRDRGRGRG
ncbi:MAG: hypothetical protein Q9160_007011 [Pyrenula sp. 1 TL-2023]